MTSGSEGDSEKKKWGYKRQQFDAVISTTRFNGAIDNLVSGQVSVREVLRILDELNASNQRGRYMAEVLAFKQESRRLATVPYSERVAEFLMEGARRIPLLTDGLASQMAVALASAADNPAYLDTVNTAVGHLLLDLDRPLKADTRNYLRALTDKIDATRRLQEARGHLATVPSVYPPALPEQLANAKSPEPPAVDSRPHTERDEPGRLADGEVARGPIVAVGDAGTEPSDEYVEARDIESDLRPVQDGQAGRKPDRTLMMPAPEARHIPSETVRLAPHEEQAEAHEPPTQATTPSRDLAVLQGAATVLADAGEAHGATSPATSGTPIAPSLRAKSARERDDGRERHAEEAPAERKSSSATKTDPGLGATPATRAAAQAVLRTGGQATTADPKTADERIGDEKTAKGDTDQEIRIPTRKIPIWVTILALGGLISGGLGIWLLTRSSRSSDVAPESSVAAGASASAAPSAKSAKRTRKRGPNAAASASAATPTPPPEVPAAQPPPPPPPPAQPAPAAPPPAAAAPTPSPKPSKGIARAPVTQPSRPSTPPQPRTSSPAPAVPKNIEPKPKATAEPKPVEPKPKATAEAPASPSPPLQTPKPSRTIDDILVELLQVPNDAASIEEKAHDVARVVARSARAEAEIILRRLIPEEVLAGTETVDTRSLEPVRRVVALLLKKVALDKDDNRAAIAIESLGEWAKSRKHGAAAKLTLDQLAEEPVILSRSKRLRALERVQARLGISNVGE